MTKQEFFNYIRTEITNIKSDIYRLDMMRATISDDEYQLKMKILKEKESQLATFVEFPSYFKISRAGQPELLAYKTAKVREYDKKLDAIKKEYTDLTDRLKKINDSLARLSPADPNYGSNMLVLTSMKDQLTGDSGKIVEVTNRYKSLVVEKNGFVAKTENEIQVDLLTRFASQRTLFESYISGTVINDYKEALDYLGANYSKLLDFNRLARLYKTKVSDAERYENDRNCPLYSVKLGGVDSRTNLPLPSDFDPDLPLFAKQAFMAGDYYDRTKNKLLDEPSSPATLSSRDALIKKTQDLVGDLNAESRTFNAEVNVNDLNMLVGLHKRKIDIIPSRYDPRYDLNPDLTILNHFIDKFEENPTAAREKINLISDYISKRDAELSKPYRKRNLEYILKCDYYIDKYYCDAISQIQKWYLCRSYPKAGISSLSVSLIGGNVTSKNFFDSNTNVADGYRNIRDNIDRVRRSIQNTYANLNAVYANVDAYTRTKEGDLQHIVDNIKRTAFDTFGATLTDDQIVDMINNPNLVDAIAKAAAEIEVNTVTNNVVTNARTI